MQRDEEQEMTKEEALKLALEALNKALRSHGLMLLSDPPQDAWKYHRVEQTAHEAITAIKEALAQPEQEPVKWSDYEPDGMHHNKPPQRTWAEGREQAFSEIAEKMKLMPWGSDTMHSFLIWLGEQK